MSHERQPSIGEFYWFVNSHGETDIHTWKGRRDDYAYFECGNCFLSRDKAEATAKAVTKIFESSHSKPKAPELTVEVFDRPDCPKWAKWAAVNANGKVVLFSDIPNCMDDRWCATYYSTSVQACMLDDVLFDVSDWKNSLIERPKKTTLPYWFKVGEWVWVESFGYFRLTEIKLSEIRGECVDGGVVSMDYHLDEVRQARLRLYTDEELQELVGKSVKTVEGAIYLITAFNPASGTTKAAVSADTWVSALLLAEDDYTIDGKPCGVFEHLEGDVWVK